MICPRSHRLSVADLGIKLRSLKCQCSALMTKSSSSEQLFSLATQFSLAYHQKWMYYFYTAQKCVSQLALPLSSTPTSCGILFLEPSGTSKKVWNSFRPLGTSKEMNTDLILRGSSPADQRGNHVSSQKPISEPQIRMTSMGTILLGGP